MIIGRSRFNLYLALLLAVAMGGCLMHRKKDPSEQLATFRVHLAVASEDGDRTATVMISQAKPVPVIIEKDPFLTEVDVEEARVADVMGGYDLQIRLTRRGSWLLQNYSAANPGKHFAVFSQFGANGKTARWLAAPIFSRVISSGTLQFAPDATREESEQIAIGLNNVAKQVKKKSKW